MPNPVYDVVPRVHHKRVVAENATVLTAKCLQPVCPWPYHYRNPSLVTLFTSVVSASETRWQNLKPACCLPVKGSFRVTGGIAAEAVEPGSEDSITTSAAALYVSFLGPAQRDSDSLLGCRAYDNRENDCRLHCQLTLAADLSSKLLLNIGFQILFFFAVSATHHRQTTTPLATCCSTLDQAHYFQKGPSPRPAPNFMTAEMREVERASAAERS